MSFEVNRKSFREHSIFNSFYYRKYFRDKAMIAEIHGILDALFKEHNKESLPEPIRSEPFVIKYMADDTTEAYTPIMKPLVNLTLAHADSMASFTSEQEEKLRYYLRILTEFNDFHFSLIDFVYGTPHELIFNRSQILQAQRELDSYLIYRSDRKLKRLFSFLQHQLDTIVVARGEENIVEELRGKLLSLEVQALLFKAM